MDSWDVIVRFNSTKVVVSMESVDEALRSSTPITSILKLLGFQNVSVTRTKHVEQDFFLPTSITRKNLTNEEYHQIATKFVYEIDAGRSQAEAARLAGPGKKLSEIKQITKRFYPEHRLFRKAQPPRTPVKKLPF